MSRDFKMASLSSGFSRRAWAGRTPLLLSAALFLSSIIPSPSARADEGQERLDRGVAYFEARDYQHAITEFTAVLALAPRDAHIWVNRAHAYYNLHDFPHAIADFNRATEINPRYADAFYECAKANLAVDNYSAAIEQVNKALNLNADFGDGYRLRGDIYFRDKQYDPAIASYNKTLSLASHYGKSYRDELSYRAHLGKAEAYVEKGDEDNALTEIESALKHRTDEAEVYFVRGNIHAGRAEWTQARADYDTVIRLMPKAAVAFYNRATAQAQLGNLPEAKVDIARAHELDASLPLIPDDELKNLGKSEVAKAADALVEAVHKLDDSMAAAEKSAADVAAADKTIANIVTGNTTPLPDAGNPPPHDVDFYMASALDHGRAAEPDAAIADYARAIEIDPKNAPAYRRRGAVYFYLKGDFKSAVSDFKISTDLDPKSAETWANLGLAQFRTLDPLADIEKDPAALDTLNDALANVQKAIRLDKSLSPLHFDRALMFATFGDWSKAEDEYQDALEHPDTVNIRKALAEVQKMLLKKPDSQALLKAQERLLRALG